MKRFFSILLVIMPALVLKAQTIETVKTKLALSQFKAAKEDLDKAMSNAKFNTKPEAYIMKTAIYAGLALDDATKDTPAGEQLRADAEAAFKKYKELDPTMSLVDDPIFKTGPVNLYSSYYTTGYTDYLAKRWAPAFEKFKKATELSDLLISKKLLAATLDTNVLILSGITAESSGNKDEAAKYYSRLADNKIGGEGYESVYKFLVTYYFGKKDMASFEKYKALGAQVYPKSEFFTFDKVDFAMGLETDFNAKLKAVEETLASDPNNFKANEMLGELIYDTLNPKKDDAPIPANASDLEKKMVIAFNKAAMAKPGFENPYLFLGDHFINKAVKINDAREAHAKDMKARTKPGTMASKADVDKRDLLDKQYGDALEGAREPYEKAAEIFAAKSSLDGRDKQQYKKAVSYLSDVYAYKKMQAKAKPADAAKYAAEEKKWSDKYDTIK